MTKAEEILRKHKRYGYYFYVSDLGDLTQLLPTDKLEFSTMEPYDYGDSAYDGHTDLIISREREYTDEEQKEFEEKMEERKIKAKDARYQDYLKLKGEFGDGYEPSNLPPDHD